MAKENITEEEELVEDFGDGYFAPYQQVFHQQDKDEDYVDNTGAEVFHQTKKNKIKMTLILVINSFSSS